MTISLETVATDRGLQDELGGSAQLENLSTETSTPKLARTLALRDVLAHFANQVPPVFEADFAVPAELTSVVTYGALARMYRNNITTGDGQDVNAAKHKIYKGLYDSGLASLRPTVGYALKASGPSIALHRR